MLKLMCNEPRTNHRRFENALGFIALLCLLLTMPGCLSLPSVARVSDRVMTGKPVSVDNLFVVISSSAGDLSAEKQLLGDSIISGLKQTEMFSLVTGNPADLGAGGGLKVSVEITAIQKVSDNAREWEGALAGRASIWLRVTVADLKSGRPIELFSAEGQSGKSAFAGTTDEAIQQAAQPVVAEMLRLNALSGS